ncbi:cysteine-rich receptor-like protein kinase 10 [Humulus lupulus]|uniref:cysteine-rich receptor-like protein kinase 10 n=1 Tax=Humulus lupulus TaxID=3486 RepID=UPI002B4137E2|nr:cysteine-rich receptor-like protein kinase 10 [Humulus lupulus]
MFLLKCSLLAIIVSSLIIQARTEAAAAPGNNGTYISHACKNSTDLKYDSTYESSLEDLLSSLSTAARGKNDFNYATSGRGLRGVVFGLFLCRGDVTSLVCQQCIASASTHLPSLCPANKEAIIWYDKCMLRYSDQPIFNVPSLTPVNFNTSRKHSNDDQFQLLRDSFISGLEVQAAYSHEQSRKFAVGKQNLTSSGSETMYGLVQCTPDLSVADCSKCFLSAKLEIPRCCAGDRSVRLLLPSCYVMYDLEPFFEVTAIETPPPPSPPPSGKTKTSSVVIVISVVVPVIVATLLLVVGCYFLRKRATKKYNALIAQENVKDLTKDVESLQFSFKNIDTATNNFSAYNMLGKGGFGDVYKGMLINGREIAVKRLSKSSGQGAAEFKNEVVLVAKLQHKNLVRLLGFCLEGDEKILVYEYVPNKSLDYFLFDPKKQCELNWSIRCKIIEGIARGILYLHEDSRLKIIHRDLKASNILLDKNMSPKVSDFGMAKMFSVDQTQGNTKRIVGTYGYMAPEYAMEGLYSVKSDVFSFGVLLLEILSGRKNSSFHIGDCAPSLVAYAWQLWNEERVLDLMDPWLKDSCYQNEFMRYIHIALLCVQEDANLRPTMSSVVSTLKSEAPTLSHPERPAFISTRRTSHQEIIAINSFSVNAGMTVSDLLPR